MCAAATRTLLARGRREVIARHSAKEPHRARRAIVLAGLGDLSVPTVSDLAAGTLAGLEEVDTTQAADDGDAEVTPVMRLIADSLLSTLRGLELTTDLLGGVQDLRPACSHSPPCPAPSATSACSHRRSHACGSPR